MPFASLKRKYSSSGPTLNVSKPSLRIRSSARRRTYRGSPSYGLPSGVTTSQIIRPTFDSPERHGMTTNVSGSGIATMSDSSIALNPVIDEPSKPIPSSSAPSSSSGVIAKLFRCPSRSVNQRSIDSIPSVLHFARTCCRVSSLDVARFFDSICAISPPQKRKKPRARTVRARGHIAYGRSQHSAVRCAP